ncbi:MAG: mechanosensitive ion channel family protein [Leptolyngbyaceae cyanobacterium MO_188.B28]|nr:mechanosensitive ion channel family protein [Leptolyngbyaceae cyanobacterium MO_188.B28]
MQSIPLGSDRLHFNRMGKRLVINLLGILLLLVCITSSFAHAQSPRSSLEQSKGYPVVLQGETLFQIETGVASFPASFRARVISERIETFAKESQFDIDMLQIVDNEQTQTSDIRVGNDVVVTITPADANVVGLTRQALAQQYLEVIKEKVVDFRQAYSLRNLIVGAILTLVITIALIISVLSINWGVIYINQKLKDWQGTRIRGFRLFRTELIHADRVADFFSELVNLSRLAAFILLLVGYASLTLSFFPWTKAFSRQIFSYLGTAAYTLWENFVGYIPNLFFIVLIVVITAYILRLIKFIFTEIRRSAIVIPGFYPEWARPTYNLMRFAIIAFAAIIVFPYLPGSNSPAFQGVSIFLGVLFSLGSSGAVANFVAGIILTYSRAFVIGDRVKISETIGDVIEKTLLVTRINTPKNVIVTIPNSMILGSHIINYSNTVRSENAPPLIVHTTITLGYDVPWRKVHTVLIEAAQATEHILSDPAPFVLQTSLDDFYVSYELNAYTDKASKASLMPRIYSALHQNLQDKCNEAGIEILSPHYSAVRDGNQLTVPPDYIPKEYVAPGFRMNSSSQFFHPPAHNPDNPPQP